MNIVRNTLAELGNTGWIKGDFDSYEATACGTCVPCKNREAEASVVYCEWPDYGDITGVCILGAVGLAYKEDSRYLETNEPEDADEDLRIALETITDVIEEQYPDRLEGIITKDRDRVCWPPHFNDHPETTIEDVILVLEKAAIKLDEHA